MRRSLRVTILLLTVAAMTLPALADAIAELSVQTETDEKRNKIYYLVNRGSKTIKAKVQMEKRCTSVANTQKPVEREYWIRPGEKIKLGMSWSRSTCKRNYRIIKAQHS